MDLLAPLRTRLRITFAGQAEGVPAWEEALEHGDDAGYFLPDSAVWTVHGGMTPIAAGIRALLVQALHPGALAGVAEHSDYRADPLARLAGTIRWIFTVTYGDTVAARAACDYVRRRHRSVTGTYTDAAGAERPYSANDPGLAGVGPPGLHGRLPALLRDLPRPGPAGGADAYVSEWAVAGELMGVADPPRTEAALRARLQAYDDGGFLCGGPRVEEVVRFLEGAAADPMLLPGADLLFAAVVDTLPERYRELLGLERARLGPVPLPTRLAGRIALGAVGASLQKVGPSELAEPAGGWPGSASCPGRRPESIRPQGESPASFPAFRRRTFRQRKMPPPCVSPKNDVGSEASNPTSFFGETHPGSSNLWRNPPLPMPRVTPVPYPGRESVPAGPAAARVQNVIATSSSQFRPPSGPARCLHRRKSSRTPT